MKPVQYTVRLPASLDNALRSLARQQNTSVYAALQLSVQAGIAALANPPAPGTDDRELVAELASLGTRIVDVERLLDRTLFTACAAYPFNRPRGKAANMIDRYEIDTQRKILGVNCKRWIAQGCSHVEEGSRVATNPVNACIADLPDDKRATIRDAGIAIAA